MKKIKKILSLESKSLTLLLSSFLPYFICHLFAYSCTVKNFQKANTYKQKYVVFLAKFWAHTAYILLFLIIFIFGLSTAYLFIILLAFDKPEYTEPLLDPIDKLVLFYLLLSLLLSKISIIFYKLYEQEKN